MNKIKLCINDNDGIDGILTIYPTDIAALLLINTGNPNQTNNIQFESSPFLKPFRELNGTYIIDLLYFIYFTVIDSPPKISFHDRINSNVINIIFSDINSQKQIIDEMKLKFILKSKDVSGYYEIIKYHPPYSSHHKNYKKSVSYSHVLTETIQIENALLLYQGVIGHIPNKRNFLDFNIETFKKESLYTLKLKSSNRFDAYLYLLNLPRPTNFDKYKNDYMTLKKQWCSFTPSQLKRSPELRDIISNVSSLVKSSKNHEKYIEQILFNILMSIIQTNRRFMKNIKNIFNILSIILYVMNLIPSGDLAKSKSMIINGQYDIDIDTIESIIFWILLKILYRFEILKLFECNSKDFYSEIQQFISNEMPFLHKCLSTNYHYEDLSCLENSINCLFADFFDLDDCVDMWSVALTFECSNYYFISIVISVLMYHFDIYEKYTHQRCNQKTFCRFHYLCICIGMFKS